MAALKEELSAESVGRLADALATASPAFRRDVLDDGIAEALAPLELKARSALIAERLCLALPADFREAAAAVRPALGDPRLEGWVSLPVGDWVALAGIDEPEVALPLLAELTPLFSSEFAIRPFLERHPEVTLAHLHRWVDDPSEQVRRLVSEGTRPRLPWASRLGAFIADPTPTIALLDRLHEDPSPFVRRSVANHLNDITKDHPDMALDCARRWLPCGERSAEVVRHGLRTLVKQGDPAALAVLGIDHDADVRLTVLSVEPEAVSIGEAVTVRFTLALHGERPSEVVVDYAVHHVGANGVNAPKVFKFRTARLQPGVPAAFTKRHRFRDVSIRRLRPGPHQIDILVNGTPLGSVTVQLAPTAPAAITNP